MHPKTMRGVSMKRFSLRSARSRTRLAATGAVACAMAGTMALSWSGTRPVLPAPPRQG